MDNAELAKAYQWNNRPQCPKRPSWFSHWPGGNRIAATFNIMHEWESVPRSTAIRKRELMPGATGIEAGFGGGPSQLPLCSPPRT